MASCNSLSRSILSLEPFPPPPTPPPPEEDEAAEGCRPPPLMVTALLKFCEKRGDISKLLADPASIRT